MKIHLYSTCYNEEQMIPYYLRYYGDIADKIFIFDNESTDDSRKLFKAHPKVTLFGYSTNNTVDDTTMQIIHNNAYKTYSQDADWVICCDIDEILVATGGLRQKLSEYLNAGVVMPKVLGFQMIAKNFVKSEKQIYEVCPCGVRDSNYDKPCIFRPFVDIKYNIGLHGADPQCDQFIYSTFEWVSLLHYKFFGRERSYQRVKLVQSRLSETNKKNDWGKLDLDDFYNWFDRMYKNRIQIVT